MEIRSSNRDDRLAEVQEHYDRAHLEHDKKRDDFRKSDAQYRGSSDIDDDPNASQEAINATVVWNISFELLEGSIDTDIPQPFVSPEFKCEHNIRNARRIETLIKMLMDKQPWELYNDEQDRTVKKFGTAGTIVEWDVDSTTRTTVGEASVSPIRPHHIYPQPGITNINDCDYVFVDYLTTKAEIKRKYSLTEEELEQTELRTDFDSNGDEVDDSLDVVTLTVFWYRNDSGDVCRFVYSGDIILEDDDDYYSRKVEYCETCGRRREICEAHKCRKPKYFMNKLDYDELTEDIKCSDGRIIPAWSPVIEDGELQLETVQMPVTNPDGSQAFDIVAGVEVPAIIDVQVPKMKKTRLPFYKPKTLPIAIRYNIRDDKSFWGISDMEIIRDNQIECNKLTSRIHEAVMKSGADLMMPEGAKITPSNGIFDNIIEIGPSSDQRQYGVYSYSVDISQWLVERDNHKEQAKKLLGISDSFLGQADSTAKSGYAKSIQVQQSAGRLASKKVMKQAHFADIFRILFELYLAFADEPRQVHHEEDMNSSDTLAAEERFNRFDYYEFDPMTGEFYINDNFTFAVDQNGSFEQQYPQLWEIVKADFMSGMYGDAAQIDTQIAVWQHLEKLRYPFARNIVEMKKKQKEEMLAAQQAQMQQATVGAGATVSAGMAEGNMIGGEANA